MKVLIVHAHPEPLSFCGALFETAIETLEAAGHTVMTSDLYAMGFDPVSDRRNFHTQHHPTYLRLQQEERYAARRDSFTAEIDGEMAKLEEAELLILLFPLWWFGLPAILKGWVDRVFAMGRIYEEGQLYQHGRFAKRRALLCVTTGADEPAYQPEGLHGDIHAILRPIERGILQCVGYQVLAPALFHGPEGAELVVREHWLDEWAARLTTIERESPIEVGRYR
ncbi:NAD(P)H-dependent oxidoreductase [Aeromonas simiae]|uniref:NAD(P)H-dependent oxidoreductase n=1 Tax=Aeromonas simiae TaxID=218936 RepID=A0A5J6WXR5_9GAMM|nr:NAD(P)H-dependent oxidoreductase [Aeromonas simiae]QFI54937.1 NAD(P)H-dependent oxidoreductase [Aeromonas simiae]